MYSITSRQSFNEIDSFSNQILRVKDVESFPMVLVGNKCDLERVRQVPTVDGETKANHWGIPFFEASASLRINIEESFFQLVREINARTYAGRPDGVHPNYKKKSPQANKKSRKCTIL